MDFNVKAWDLRAKLFALTNEFKELALAMHNADHDGYSEVDATGCQLAEIYQNLPPVFTEASRD